MSNTVRIFKQEPDYARLISDYENASEFLLSDLKALVKPGDIVVLKPNFVKESHLSEKNQWEQIITHGEIIRFVLRYVVELLKNSGEIYIVDAPQTDSDYDEIISRIDLPGIVNDIQEKTTVKIEYYDLREERWHCKDGIIIKWKTLAGDPKGYTSVNLKECSEFAGKENKNYYGADFDTDEIKKYHNQQDNIYVMSNTILNADVFINLPKLKTHKLGGITACLKNLVGTCVIKNSIPHHTMISKNDNGDAFKHATNKSHTEGRLKKTAYKLLKYRIGIINRCFVFIKWVAGMLLGSSKTETIRNGAWYGNDTIWRSTLDLNKILLYADKNGVMQNTPQRKYFALVDGIIAGEGKGPMEADRKECGVMISGTNPVYIDTAAARLMGFDYSKIPTIINAYNIREFPLTDSSAEEINIVSNNAIWNKPVTQINKEDTLHFKPHFGWKGYIEIT